MWHRAAGLMNMRVVAASLGPAAGSKRTSAQTGAGGRRAELWFKMSSSLRAVEGKPLIWHL